MKNKIYSIVRFVQSADDDYNRIEAVFSGISLYYCEGNSQPVIDYLSDWDDEEIEPADGWTDTAINDMFWFDFDTIAQHLGYEDEEDFDRQHDPNYLDDDDLEEYVEEWFASFLQTVKEREGTDAIVYLYENCFGGDYLDFASTEAEEEEAQNAPDYPDWIGERIYDHLLKEYGASDLMEALFEDDNGHENLTDFPTKEQFRDEMMRVHKKSEEQ